MTAPTIAPGLCPCGAFRSQEHACEYTAGRGNCLRCLAPHGDPECCTPERLARLVRVPSKKCGCIRGDDCCCGEWVRPVQIGIADYSRRGRRFR